jgi:DNA mismatch repair ATPase MutS
MIVQGKSVLITGSNMSGKTSFIRTIGVNALSGYVLNTCFARSFLMNGEVRIHSMIAMTDNLSDGKSYFFEEALLMKELLSQCRAGTHLFLLDEVFKGTNEQERRAISLSVLRKLSQKGNLVFASTHDGELCKLLSDRFD